MLYTVLDALVTKYGIDSLSGLWDRSLVDMSQSSDLHAAASSTRDFRSPSPLRPVELHIQSPEPEHIKGSDQQAIVLTAANVDVIADSKEGSCIPPVDKQDRAFEKMRRPISLTALGDLSTIAESERSRELEFSLSVIEASGSASASEAMSTPPSVALARHLPPLDTSAEGLIPVSKQAVDDRRPNVQKRGSERGRSLISQRAVDEGNDTLVLSDLARSVHARGQALLVDGTNGSDRSRGATSSSTFSPGSLLSPWSAFASSGEASSSRPASSYASTSASPVNGEGNYRGNSGSSSSECVGRQAANRLSARWDAGIADLRRAIADPASSASNYSDEPEGADADIDTEDLDEEPPSFNLGALDPDLAELLRANAKPANASAVNERLSSSLPDGNIASETAPTFKSPFNTGLDSVSVDNLPSPPLEADPFTHAMGDIEGSRVSSPTLKLSDQQRGSHDGSGRPSADVKRDSYTDERTSRNSQGRTLGTQSSPARRTRSRPASLALSATASDHGRRGSVDTLLTTVVRGGSIDGIEDTPALLQPTTPTELGYGRASRSPLTQGSSSEHRKLASLSTSRRPNLSRSYSALGTSEFGEQLRIDRDADGLTTRRRLRSGAPRLYATPARPSTIVGGPGSQRVASDGAAPHRPGSASGFRFGAGPRSAGTVSALGHRDVHTSMSMASHTGPPPTPTRARSALGGSITLTSRTRRYGDGFGHSQTFVRERERPGTALGASIGSMSNSNLLASPSIRTRKRSASAAGPDWTHRRTARAFADAGLLDRTVQIGPSFTRSGAEAPSMYGGSDMTTPRADPWLTSVGLGPPRGGSPATTTTGRTGTSMSSLGTMRRSGSTATSLSAGGSPSPPAYMHLAQGREGTTEVEMAFSALRSKHAVEIEALVSALADAQRSTRELRTENARLNARVQILEDDVASLQTRRNPPPEPLRYRERGTVDTYLGHRHSRSGSTEAVRSARIAAYLQEARSRAENADVTPLVTPGVDFLQEMADWEKKRAKEGLEITNSPIPDYLSPTQGRQRASTVSSGFPPLPSNMSMLLHDEDAGDSALVTSGAESGKQSKRISHRPHPSVSSAGSTGPNASGTSPSILSLPGSSASLVLRPEHERHLRDMISLDFNSLNIDSD